MALPRNLITVDGPPGSGKSTLAKGLRSSFDCDVIEIGPVFRLVAWGRVELGLPTLRTSAEFVREGFLTRQLTIGNAEHKFSAVELKFKGDDITDSLWSPHLANEVRRAAEDPVVVLTVKDVCRRLVMKPRKMVVVGREAGSSFFPLAGLRLRLVSCPEVARDRKLRQFKLRPTDWLKSEARQVEVRAAADLVVDTTESSVCEIRAMLISVIRAELGWTILGGVE